MIEITRTYDILPGVDTQFYGEFAKKVIGTLMKAPGLIEFRGNRNMLGSPQVRTIQVWQSLADWAKFSESAEYSEFEAESRSFITNMKVEIWGPSPVVPEPLRPSK
jgi:heme-degrading monooxygenase HmoA